MLRPRYKGNYKQRQEVNKLPEYQKRKQELLNILNLEDNQKNAKDLLEEYNKINQMRKNFLKKISEANTLSEEILGKISEVTTKILLANDKEEENSLLQIKNNYKLQLEQLEDLSSTDIYPTIAEERENIMNSELSEKAHKEFLKLTDIIDEKLKEIRKEAEERKLMYTYLEIDLLDIRDSLDYEKCRKLNLDLKIATMPKTNDNVKYAMYIQNAPHSIYEDRRG